MTPPLESRRGDCNVSPHLVLVLFYTRLDCYYRLLMPTPPGLKRLERRISHKETDTSVVRVYSSDLRTIDLERGVGEKLADVVKRWAESRRAVRCG